ncbi:MAG: hypothetical protein RLZZ578_1382 [Bacteroidota bacterium]|jgi:hypothetical protein
MPFIAHIVRIPHSNTIFCRQALLFIKKTMFLAQKWCFIYVDITICCTVNAELGP